MFLREGTFWRDGVCSERGSTFWREGGLYPRLNQFEDERSQTRSGNESNCIVCGYADMTISLTWAACIVREVIDILLRF